MTQTKASSQGVRRRAARGLAVSVLLLMSSSVASAAALPTLPNTFDAGYSVPTGKMITLNAGGDLQAALNQAQLGDTIILQAGARFTGPFTLPNKSSGNGWIYVQSSNYAKLPTSGSRVSPTDATNMPAIVSPSHDSAIVTVNGTHHFRFVGIEFTTAPNTYTTNLVQLHNNDKSTATLTHHITFDRCYFFADTSIGARRGLLGNAAYLAVVDSYFDGFREHGADSQAIVAFNTSGPVKIVNNYLSGAGENLMFGGGDSASVALVPSDIEIRGNYFFKPLSWIGSTWVVKNLLEFKSAQRVLVSGNVFENNWAAGQNGFALLITPRNQDGTAPWSITQDITISDNRFTNIGSGLNIVGTDNLKPSQPTSRVLVKNNLISVNGLNGAHGWGFMILDGPSNVIIDHNTILSSSAFLVAENAAGIPKTEFFTFTNNIAVSSTYGFVGSGTGQGLDALNTFFSDWTFARNVLTVGPESAYPSGTFFPASAFAIGFTNALAGNYTLLISSPYHAAGTDGRDLGADLTLVPSATRSIVPTASNVPAVPEAPSELQVN